MVMYNNNKSTRLGYESSEEARVRARGGSVNANFEGKEKCEMAGTKGYGDFSFAP